MIRNVLIALAIASTVVAQTEIRPYISFSGGYGILNDGDVTVNGSTSEFKYEDGVVLEAALGIKFAQAYDEEAPPIRAELAFSDQRNDDEFNDEIRTMTLMANAYLDIPTGTGFTPYFMIGMGAANVDDTELDDDVFAFQMGGGIGYSLTKHLILDLKYKYFQTEDLEFQIAADEITVEVSAHQIQAGIRYQF